LTVRLLVVCSLPRFGYVAGVQKPTTQTRAFARFEHDVVVLCLVTVYLLGPSV
jgi:hypothetical protein